MEARAACDSVNALYSAAYDKVGAWAFGWPEVDFSNPLFTIAKGRLGPGPVRLDDIKRYNRQAEIFASVDLLAMLKAQGRERIRWWIKAHRAQKAAQEAVGLPQLEALLDTDYERRSAIEDRIWDTPAETLRGVVIRLREARRDYVAFYCCSDDDDGDFYADAFGKVLQDLERLTAEARS